MSSPAAPVAPSVIDPPAVTVSRFASMSPSSIELTSDSVIDAPEAFTVPEKSWPAVSRSTS